MEKQNGAFEIDVIRLLKAMWSGIIYIVILAVLGAGIAFSYARFFIAPTYQSSALLFVNSNSLSLGDMRMSVSDLSLSTNLVNYYITILNTRTTLNEVIEEAELDYSYEQLKNMISSKAVEDTAIFSVTVTSTDPVEAEKIANTITRVLPQRIETIIENSSARVVDSAVVPVAKSAPNVTKITAIGMLLGALIAAGIIALREITDDLIHNGNDISDDFDIPVLAEIPDLLEGTGKDEYRRYGRYGYYGKYSRYDRSNKYAQYDQAAKANADAAKEGSEK